ncbi:MAG: transcriptional regulator BetI [Pseudomonadota bacterium]
MPRTGMMAIRKDALVNAAIACVGKRGSLDVTVGQIAKEAGVSSALAHHYFGSKDQLLLSAMRAILREFGAQARLELAGAGGPEGRLKAIVTASFVASNFRPEVVSAWLNFYVMAQTQPEAARLLRVYQRRLVSNLTHALRPLCDDPHGVARTTAALIDGLYIHALTQPAGPDTEAATACVMAYLDGITR